MGKDFARGERLSRNPYPSRKRPSWGDPDYHDSDLSSLKPKKEENWLTLREKERNEKSKTFTPIPPELTLENFEEYLLSGKIPDPKPIEARWQPEPEPSQTPTAQTKPSSVSDTNSTSGTSIQPESKAPAPQKSAPTLVATTDLTPGMLAQPLPETGQNGQIDPAPTDLKSQKQEPKPPDPTQDKKKLAWVSPLDMLDYLGLGVDVLERAYIEMGMKPGQEKDFARFSNTLYFAIDTAMAILPGAGGGGLAVRASHEAGVAAWHLLPASAKAKVIQELAKKMGWTATRASQAVNVFFSMKAGKVSGKDGKDGNKDGNNKRPADLPSSKKVEYDWDHIFRGHWEGASTTAKGNKTIFEGLNQNQIKSVVQSAYKNIYKKLQTQGDKIRVRGRSGKWNIEMWVDKTTKKVETAYPVEN